MEEMNKVSLETEGLESMELQTYMQQTIVLIGEKMDAVFKNLVASNEGKKNAILFITQERSSRMVPSIKLKYENFKDDYGDSFVSVTDRNGRSMDDDGNASRITYPEVIHIKFKKLESDRELRHASEIVSGFVDNSWVTIVASDLSEGFARNIHSSLVYRRNKFNNAVASVVFTRTSNPNDEFSLKVMRESIKKNTHSYMEIGDEKKIRNTVFSKKGGDTETERMIYEIAKIQNKFK